MSDPGELDLRGRIRAFITVDGALPGHGAFDATWIVTVLVPLWLGLIAGDIGFGLVCLAVAVALRTRWSDDHRLQAAVTLLARTAIVAVVAGALYGEFFGDLALIILRLEGVTLPQLHGRGYIVMLLMILSLGAIAVQFIVGGVATWLREGWDKAWRHVATDVSILAAGLVGVAAVEWVMGILLGLVALAAQAGNRIIGVAVMVIVFALSAALVAGLFALLIGLQSAIAAKLMGDAAV